MCHESLILLVLPLCTGAALAADGPPRTLQEKLQALFTRLPPRTVEEKVDEADLIVRGNASLFGEEKEALRWEGKYNTAFFGLGNDPLPSLPHEPFVVYQRNLRVDVTEVLWPPSPKGITNIVFGCYIAKNWPPSWCAYTNTPGIFFLTKKDPPDNEEWTKLDRFDDWIEPTTNAPSVQAAITKIRVRGGRPIRQPDGAANGSQPIRSDTNSTSSAAGSRR